MLANTADVAPGIQHDRRDAVVPARVGRHVAHTDDLDLAADLSATVTDILSAHVAGTRFGIGVDASTGLLRGAPTAGH